MSDADDIFTTIAACSLGLGSILRAAPAHFLADQPPLPEPLPSLAEPFAEFPRQDAPDDMPAWTADAATSERQTEPWPTVPLGMERALDAGSAPDRIAKEAAPSLVPPRSPRFPADIQVAPAATRSILGQAPPATPTDARTGPFEPHSTPPSAGENSDWPDATSGTEPQSPDRQFTSLNCLADEPAPYPPALANTPNPRHAVHPPVAPVPPAASQGTTQPLIHRHDHRPAMAADDEAMSAEASDHAGMEWAPAADPAPAPTAEEKAPSPVAPPPSHHPADIQAGTIALPQGSYREQADPAIYFSASAVGLPPIAPVQTQGKPAREADSPPSRQTQHPATAAPADDGRRRQPYLSVTPAEAVRSRPTASNPAWIAPPPPPPPPHLEVSIATVEIVRTEDDAPPLPHPILPPPRQLDSYLSNQRRK
jgi:hypothetical protein